MTLGHKLAALTLVPHMVPACAAPPEKQSARAATLDQLEALHRTTVVQIMHLEARVESLAGGWPESVVSAYTHNAVVLLDLLVRALGLPDVAPESTPSFDSLLGAAILLAYGWAVDGLADVARLLSGRHAASSKSIPHELLSVFHGLAELCASSGTIAAREHVDTLEAIDDAVYRMIDLRDHIERTQLSSRPEEPPGPVPADTRARRRRS